MNLPKGYLISIGGAEDKKEDDADKENSLDFLKHGILKNVVDLMKVQEPSIEVITTATSYPEDTYRNYKEAFTELGCVHVGHLNIRNREAANDKSIIQRLEKCNGVMFSGGDQSKLCAILGGTLLLDILKERYMSDNFVIAGTSAGAAAMCGTMMNGGRVEKACLKGEIDLSVGFGFVNNMLIDTHFDKRGRFARLVQAIATQPGVVGIGLGEDTGVVIEKGTILRAIGSSCVTIIDGSKIKYNNIADVREGMPISLANVIVNILSHSDLYDIKSRQYTPVIFEEHEK